jgi:uncharacterized protein YbjT (DUF2867 family)
MEANRALVIGATGMVGGHVLRCCLASNEISGVTVIGRRETGFSHPKLVEVLHSDFLDYSAVADALVGHEVALFCLGAYSGSVSDEELKKVTADYVVAFSKALHRGSPKAAVCLLSGQGADSTEKSRVPFARYKGMAENALLRQGFARVHLFRPGYIYPVEPRLEPNFLYRAMRALYPLVRSIYPNIGIAADDLARVMVEVALHGAAGQKGPALENADIRRLAKT